MQARQERRRWPQRQGGECEGEPQEPGTAGLPSLFFTRDASTPTAPRPASRPITTTQLTMYIHHVVHKVGCVYILDPLYSTCSSFMASWALGNRNASLDTHGSRSPPMCPPIGGQEDQQEDSLTEFSAG